MITFVLSYISIGILITFLYGLFNPKDTINVASNSTSKKCCIFLWPVLILFLTFKFLNSDRNILDPFSWGSTLNKKIYKDKNENR